MPSSVIQSFRYHPAAAALDILFASGRWYRYAGVPAAVADALAAAPSRGAYFSHAIRDRYPAQRRRDPFGQAA